MRRLVVLGTGTAVGKTHVTTALARALHAARPNLPILPLKPIETGHSPDATTPSPSSDAAALETAAANVRIPRPHPMLSFAEPVSPHLAARHAQAQIDPIAVAAQVRAYEHYATLHHLPPRTDGWTLVETAGGVFSPLSPDATTLHLARALEPAAWLLVAPDSLGVLHDITACLTAMRATARAPDWITLTAARPTDSSTGTNASELQRLGIAAIAAVLPRNDPSAATALAAALLAHPPPPVP